MRLFKKIIVSLLILYSSYIGAQTPGFNYQALILNSSKIQIPGTDVKENQVPLGLENVLLRFTVENANAIEYTEEHKVTTDENGMISLIVGEGVPLNGTFASILWDGKVKFLNVEINIPKNNNDFILLDSQKILYIPHPKEGSNVVIVSSIQEISPPYTKGDLVWTKSFGQNNNPTLLIWDGANWVPVNNDYDPTNELGLIVATTNANRDTQLPSPKTGDQVWNQACSCIQVFNGSIWKDIGQDFGNNTIIANGLTKNGNQIEFGGPLTKPTEITTTSTNTLSIKGLQTATVPDDNELVVIDKNSGELKKMPVTSTTKVEESLIVANDGQNRFNVPLPITDVDKINVFRNGVRIDFNVINTTTIELESGVVCYQKDEIRIVQIN